MYCSNCGRNVSDGLQYCPLCGVHLSNNTYNNAGGSYNTQTQANYAHAGEYRQHYNDLAYDPQSNTNRSDNNNTTTTIIVTIALLALIIVVVVASFLFFDNNYDAEYTLNSHSLIRINDIEEGESCNVEIESLKKDKRGQEYSGAFVLTRKQPMAVVDLAEAEYSMKITYRATVVVHKLKITETYKQNSATFNANDLNGNPSINNEDIHSITAVSKPVAIVTTTRMADVSEVTTYPSYGAPALKQKKNTTKKRTTTTTTTTTKPASSKIRYNETYYDITEYETGLAKLEYSSNINLKKDGTFEYDYMVDWEGTRMYYFGSYYIDGDRIICIPETYHYSGYELDEDNSFIPDEQSGRVEELDNYSSSNNKIVFEITSEGTLWLERQFDSYNIGHDFEVR